MRQWKNWRSEYLPYVRAFGDNPLPPTEHGVLYRWQQEGFGCELQHGVNTLQPHLCPLQLWTQDSSHGSRFGLIHTRLSKTQPGSQTWPTIISIVIFLVVSFFNGLFFYLPTAQTCPKIRRIHDNNDAVHDGYQPSISKCSVNKCFWTLCWFAYQIQLVENILRHHKFID